ncbi:hypothetical protein Ac2012v2_007935 [Leucoagaricus gongylophorus]
MSLNTIMLIPRCYAQSKKFNVLFDRSLTGYLDISQAKMPSVAPYHPAPASDSDNESEVGSEGLVDPTGENLIDDEVEELEADDFPSYFNEADGRLFHSSPTSPYPLPVDTPEQERLKAFDGLIDQLGDCCIDSVHSILAHNPNRQARVLDLCTGTGAWLMNIASKFPSVLFTGIDIVPIATRYPLPNVNFELGDIGEEFRWPDATFDFIHGRNISWSVHNYADILPEVIRVLRPGGLYHSGELENAVFFNPDFHQTDSPRIHAPASTQFFQVVNDAVLARGILPSIDQIHIHLWNTGAFNNIQSRNILHPNRQVARRSRNAGTGNCLPANIMSLLRLCETDVT